jgi:hypothetical protein
MADTSLAGTYRFLGGWSRHDLAAMRELLGMPKRVIAVHQAGRFLNVIFEYEGFTTSFETGVDHNRRIDFPAEECTVLIARHEPAPISAQVYGDHRATTVSERMQTTPAGRLPYPHRSVSSPRKNPIAIGTQAH